MEFTVWWDYEYNPNKPWSYSITYLGETALGCAVSLQDCWKAVNMFVSVTGERARVDVIQDNNPWRKDENSSIH